MASETTTGKLIKIICVTPTKEIPLEAFKEFHRMAYFIELMGRNEDGLVIWDEDASDIYSEQLAEAEWHGLQNDWFSISMELPEEMVKDFLVEDEE